MHFKKEKGGADSVRERKSAHEKVMESERDRLQRDEKSQKKSRSEKRDRAY